MDWVSSSNALFLLVFWVISNRSISQQGYIELCVECGDVQGPESNAMLKYLSTDEKLRFAQLQGKLAQLLIDAQEQQELASLVSKAQQASHERDQAIATARQLIATHSISVESLFESDDIRRALADAKGKARNKVKAGNSVKAVKAGRRQEQVLIQVKLDKGAGAPSRYKKGQKLGKFVSRNFKNLDVNGQLLANLLKYATPAGREYFETQQGKAELQAFAEFVHRTPLSV